MTTGRALEPICIIDVTQGKRYYYHFDGLGSVVAISDDCSDIVERYKYDVFGKPTIYDANNTQISQSTVGNPYMFTGRRYDDETGLYYYRARYYSPNIGRFLQHDPLGYVDGMNLYTYCKANPVNYIDPLGLYFGDAWTPIGAWNDITTGRYHDRSGNFKHCYMSCILVHCKD